MDDDISAERTDWQGCHVCGINELEGGSVTIDGEWASQEEWCLVCGSTWEAVYKAHGRENVQPADNAAAIGRAYWEETHGERVQPRWAR